MSGTLLFGWGIWAVFGAATLIYWAEIAYDIFADVAVLLSDAFRALACTLLTSWFFLIPDLEKLHLFWLALIVITVGDWIEYRRIPPVIRAMRNLVGPQPIKHKPAPQLIWTAQQDSAAVTAR